MSLTPAEMIALSKVKVSKELRNLLPVGKHSLDFKVEVSGILKVSIDTDASPTSSIPILPVIALAIKKMGIQREAFLNCLHEAMSVVLTSPLTTREALEYEADLSNFEEMFLETVVVGLPRTPKKGSVVAEMVVKRI